MAGLRPPPSAATQGRAILQRQAPSSCTKHLFGMLQSLSGHQSPVECVTFDNAEEVVVAGAAGGTIKLWDLEEAKGAHACIPQHHDVAATRVASLRCIERLLRLPTVATVSCGA